VFSTRSSAFPQSSMQGPGLQGMLESLPSIHWNARYRPQRHPRDARSEKKDGSQKMASYMSRDFTPLQPSFRRSPQLSKASVARVLHSLATRAKVQAFSPHDLRRPYRRGPARPRSRPRHGASPRGPREPHPHGSLRPPGRTHPSLHGGPAPVALASSVRRRTPLASASIPRTVRSTALAGEVSCRPSVTPPRGSSPARALHS
jgi:hypothetical protein